MIAETFIRGRGPLYGFDPRPKFILLIFAVMLFLIESNLIVIGGLLLIILVFISVSLGIKRVLIPVKSILPILILTALLTPPFNTGGTIFLSLGKHVILTDHGIQLTVRLILRFSGITAAFYLFFSTTETSSFILALRALGLPYPAALTVTISLRYIPDMFSTYSRISDAHKLRTAGSIRNNRGFRHRVHRLFPVLISVLIHAVKSIPALAMALDSKGFGRSNPRTSCRRLCGWGKISLQLIISTSIIAALTTLAVLC
ncbi:MAG TPA: hypothetical protein DCO79_04040 [Spirochaeta sp.]|nr:hypothetical protein [Spirochaeta sp.]